MTDTAISSIEYAPDSEGNTFKCRDCVYKGERITYGPVMPNPFTLLESLDKFEPREDDIWTLTYAKSVIHCTQWAFPRRFNVETTPSVTSKRHRSNVWNESLDDVEFSPMFGCTHWLYEILSILYSGELMPNKDFKKKSMVDNKENMSDFSDIPSPRLLNSHLRLKYLPQAVLDKSKLIYMIRNPKSVAVSWYFHTAGLKYYEYEGTLAGYLPSYLEGYYSILGNWFEHVPEMWSALRNKKNALIISYEDLNKDTANVIKQIADFLCLDRTFEYCQKVKELTSFSTMSQNIGKDQDQCQGRKNAWKDQKDGFFRKGSITDWKNHLTVSQNEHFDRIYQQNMEKYPQLKELVQFE